MIQPLYLLIAFALGAGASLHLDLRRRRLSMARAAGWNMRVGLDVIAPAATSGLIATLLAGLVEIAVSTRAIALDSLLTWAFLAHVAMLVFLWHEGKRQVQLQRPEGIVFGEWLILEGACQLLAGFASHRFVSVNGLFWGTSPIVSGVVIVAGGIWLALIVPPFVIRFEGHAILERIAQQGEFVQKEYVSPTPECPHPERWQMLDAQTAELEVLDFLKSLVITVKPSLIVETGTFVGHSAIKMAEGLKANGFGRIITIEFDPAIFARARRNIEASGLSRLIESRNESSLDSKVDGVIDLLFCDSDPDIREAEIRRFLPQLAPGALVLVHDASSQFKVVREAALRLEQEGLLSVVLLPTPRGLVVAQKRQDRK